MTEKELRKLKKQDFLQLLVTQGQEMEEVQSNLEETTAKLEAVQEENERLKAKLDEKDEDIAKLKERLDNKDIQRHELEDQMTEESNRLKAKLDEKDELIEKLKNRLDEKDVRINKLRSLIKIEREFWQEENEHAAVRTVSENSESGKAKMVKVQKRASELMDKLVKRRK